MDFFDWLTDAWDGFSFSDLFSGFDWGDLSSEISQSFPSVFSSEGMFGDAAQDLLTGGAKEFGAGVSGLVSGAVDTGSMAKDFITSVDEWGNLEFLNEIGNDDNMVTGFWGGLSPKQRAAVLQAGLSGIAGGAAAYLKGKSKDKEIEAAKEMVTSRGAEDRSTLQYRQDMNKVPGTTPFRTATPGKTPAIRRPSGKPVWDNQYALGLINAARM